MTSQSALRSTTPSLNEVRRGLISIGLVIGLVALAARAYERWIFPRDPERRADPGARLVAPADGRVVYVTLVSDGTVPISVKERTEIPLAEIVKGRPRPPSGILIGIFMSPFDVHYQRSPIPGTVREVSYHPAPRNHVMGSMFLRNLFHLRPLHTKSPHIYENERNVIHVVGKDLEAFVVQIADQQVNKIDCYVSEGDEVAVGEKLGMIRRGSQVDLFVPNTTPDDFAPLRVGMKVAAGTSTLRSG